MMTKSSNLPIFLTSNLLSPIIHRGMKIPLIFASFGVVEGKMYTSYGGKGTFITTPGTRTWGNEVVYGALFNIRDAKYYLSLLDAYHSCSLSNLHRNHVFDASHRIVAFVRPIYFDTLDELQRLLYREGEPISAYVYYANLNHPKIKQRLSSSASPEYRIVSGIEGKSFTNLFREVKHAN